MMIRLSYDLTTDVIAPGGRAALRVVPDESIADGFPGNTFYYTAWNHAGSHVDAPAHMVDNGPSVTDLPIDRFIFDHPVVVDTPKEIHQLLRAEDLCLYESELRYADLVLLRTGFSRYRGTDPMTYCQLNPSLTVEAAQYLSSARFASLRAIAIDAISIAAGSEPAEGVAAHRVLFTARPTVPFLIIEDINLSFDLGHLQRVLVVPLFIVGLDSTPCTVLAELGED